MNQSRWLERTLIVIVGGALATWFFAVQSDKAKEQLEAKRAELEAEKWRGMMEERVDNVREAIGRVERKLEAIP